MTTKRRKRPKKRTKRRKRRQVRRRAPTHDAVVNAATQKKRSAAGPKRRRSAVAASQSRTRRKRSRKAPCLLLSLFNHPRRRCGRMRARVTDGTGGQGWKSGYGGKNHRQQCPDCGAKVARHAAALDQHRFLNENCLTWQFWSKMSAAAPKDDESWHKAMSQEVEASPRGAGSCRRCRRKGRSEVACSESLHCCKLNEIGRGSCLSFCRESQEAEGALRIS